MSDNPFTSNGMLATPPSRVQAPPQQPPPAAPPQPPAVPDALEGNVIGKFSEEPLCAKHFPGRAELARLTYQARTGHPAPFVGTGHEWTALSCACLAPGDHPWKLGDHTGRLAAACLRNDHDHCLDQSCECDCGPHEARLAAAAANEGQLATALREISASIGAPRELLELVASLQAKVTALEAAQAPAADAKACQAVTGTGEPCKGRPGDDGFCAAHKPKLLPDPLGTSETEA